MDEGRSMIDSLINLVFRCPHRRLTRPVTPVSRRGEPSGDTYVVCLDCGKQFSYDWEKMRIGKPVASSSAAGVLSPDLPKARNGKLKWGVLASFVPVALLVGKVLKPKRARRANSPEPPQGRAAKGVR